MINLRRFRYIISVSGGSRREQEPSTRINCRQSTIKNENFYLFAPPLDRLMLVWLGKVFFSPKWPCIVKVCDMVADDKRSLLAVHPWNFASKLISRDSVFDNENTVEGCLCSVCRRAKIRFKAIPREKLLLTSSVEAKRM